jgi:membrane protease YdiL (CAAX protease family)
MRKEGFRAKVVFVLAFLLTGAVTFVVSLPVAAWIKLKSDILSALPVQAVLALPVLFLVFLAEDRLIWKRQGKSPFSTIYPISIGFYVGYVLHFGL